MLHDSPGETLFGNISGKYLPNCFQITVTRSGIGFNVASFRPLIPGIDGQDMWSPGSKVLFCFQRLHKIVQGCSEKSYRKGIPVITKERILVVRTRIPAHGNIWKHWSIKDLLSICPVLEVLLLHISVIGLQLRKIHVMYPDIGSHRIKTQLFYGINGICRIFRSQRCWVSRQRH